MASGGEKPEVGCGQVPPNALKVAFIVSMLRLLAFLATLSATLLMALNKETRTILVATIGTVPIRATLTAKFQHTPAFVFFVIANAMASFHNLLMLFLSFMAQKFAFKGLAPLAMAVLDLMNVAIVSAGGGAAVFMGQLGRDGNSHARWNKICDKFDSFCDRGGGATIASFIGLMLMISINAISIIRLHTHYNNKLVQNPSIVP